MFRNGKQKSLNKTNNDTLTRPNGLGMQVRNFSNLLSTKFVAMSKNLSIVILESIK